jgi:hypothetical protein
MKKLFAASTMFALSLASAQSFAWVQVCNNRSNWASVSYANYVSGETTVNEVDGQNSCGQHQSSCACYSGWNVVGWARIAPFSCAQVYAPNLGGPHTSQSALFYLGDDGSIVTGPGSLLVLNYLGGSYNWDEDVSNTCGSCPGITGSGGGIGAPTCNNVTGEGFWFFNTGGYTNFTVTVN